MQTEIWRVTRQCWILDHFPRPSCTVRSKDSTEYSLQPSGRCQAGEKEQQVQWGTPTPQHQSKRCHWHSCGADSRRAGLCSRVDFLTPTEVTLECFHTAILISLHKMSFLYNKILGTCLIDSTLATPLCRIFSCCLSHWVKFKQNNTNLMESYQMSGLNSNLSSGSELLHQFRNQAHDL